MTATEDATRARRTVRAAVTVLMAVLLLVAGQPLGVDRATAASQPKCATSSWSKTGGLAKDAHPVVLVHGWTGSALTDLRQALERKAGQGWQFLLFDYHSASTQWAASPDVSGCLVKYLRQVSDAHKAKGGDGRVYVVAHSMGGLATLFAASDPSLAHRVGGLVSLATPYQGSPWGSSAPVTYGYFWELGNGLGSTAIPPYAAPARNCLAMHTGTSGMPSGCVVAPYLPKDVPVHEIAGDLTVRRTFFGVHAYDMPMSGDTIVPFVSGQGYLGSAGAPSPTGVKVGLDTVPCSLDAHAVIAEAGTLSIFGALPGVWAQTWSDSTALDAVMAKEASPAVIELLAAANQWADCSHSGLLKNDTAAGQVVTALKAQASWQNTRRNVTAAALRTAEVPENCDMPRQRLVNGQTTKRNKGADPNASGNLDSFGNGVIAAYGDFARLGYQQALVPYSCTAGGVSWPQVLLLIGEGGALLSSFDLQTIGQAEHADVDSIKAKGNAASLRWHSYEGAAFDRVDHTSTVTVDDGALQLTGVYAKSFTLGADRFGPLTLPTSPDVAIREVKPYLGVPTSDTTGDGCELAYPPLKSRTMTWGDLTLYGEFEDLQYRQITSWSLKGTNTPMALGLPYDVKVGTSLADLQRDVPGYTVDDTRVYGDGLIINQGDLSWWLDASDTKVVKIMAHAPYCE